ncbi:MAG: alpha-D-ribose 1-methylphosphonate 5-triphosphate synthase subunit PhnG [Desulfonauticus sp.]|jgi:phosphonate C-P lyase system protein PhnG|nr:alpha-D-ribose 1-methylphosphonate 5-triphosphate synthase subunit PhnG [Desulfonauticus sp.]
MKREDLNFFLQYCDRGEIKKVIKNIREKENVEVVVPPDQVLLNIPVKDQVSDIIFYAGEVLFTQSYVKVNKVEGWSMVKDIDNKLSEYIAILDSCFAQGIYVEEIKKLLKNGIDNYNLVINKDRQIATSTKVDFEIMV